MSRVWVRSFAFIVLLSIVVPIYFFSYLTIRFFWEHPVTSNDFMHAYTVSAVLIVVLLLANYLVIGFVFRDMPRLRRALVSIVIVPVAFYVLWLFLLPSQSNYRRCDLYTERMNGGVHAFENKDYRIELCGLNGGIDPENWQHDEVRLQVFAMNGELLAERFFEPLLGMGEPIAPLEYGNDHLIYDAGQGSGYHTKMAMPPSRWEWIRARLPRMWP